VADAIPDFSICPNNTVILTGTNSIGANSFNWFVLPSPTVAVGGNTSTISFTQAVGTFSYVLEAVSTATNCRDTDMVIVTVYPLPNLDVGPSFTIPLFSSVTIGGAPTSTSGAATFTWSPPLTLDNANISNPIASNTLNTTYTVTVVDPATGCVASDTMHVHLYPAIKIPNGFSPNGDNKNDRWVIDNMDQFINNEVEVYNRWGELLFRKVGYLDHFDGKYKGKDLPVGTYYYIIKLNHEAYPTPFTGPLTIFR
jgi:gliding motility-associated-like protein